MVSDQATINYSLGKCREANSELNRLKGELTQARRQRRQATSREEREAIKKHIVFLKERRRELRATYKMFIEYAREEASSNSRLIAAVVVSAAVGSPLAVYIISFLTGG